MRIKGIENANVSLLKKIFPWSLILASTQTLYTSTLNFPPINLAVAVGRVWVVKLSLYSLDKRRNHERRNLWPFELWSLIECQGSWNLESWNLDSSEKCWLSEVCLSVRRAERPENHKTFSNSLQRRNTAAKMQNPCSCCSIQEQRRR